jgi:hypothetical protein
VVYIKDVAMAVLSLSLSLTISPYLPISLLIGVVYG